jgi:hypothetical protein
MKVQNGLITLTELKTMGFTLNSGQTAPNDSNIIITKYSGQTLYNLDPNPLIPYKDNQLPPYEAFQSGPSCAECSTYDIIVTQEDINNSDDNKVYVYFYSCGNYTGEILDYMSFSYSGTFKNYICVQNCANVVPFIGYMYDGGAIHSAYNSYISRSSNDSCKVTTQLCGNTPIVYTVNKPGFNYVNKLIDIGDTCGNINITISGTSLNSDNEIFIGNYDETIGATYTYGITGFSLSDTIGYYSSNSKTTLDLIIYSSHSGTTFTPYNVTFVISCPTLVSCEPAIIGTTYVSGSTVNITGFINGCSSGYIRYDTANGTVDKYVSSVGTYTITDCIIFSSIRPAFPLFCLANWTNPPVSGTTCGANPTSGTVYMTFTTEILLNNGTIVYWVDGYGVQQSRFMSDFSTFTTCGVYGSGYGANISYGLQCTATPEPTPTIKWYQYNISSVSFAICSSACDQTVHTTSLIYSHAQSISQLLIYNVFTDTNGTPFIGSGNYYQVTKTGDVGFGYAVQIDSDGVVYDIQQCRSNNPGDCSGSL